MGTPLKSYEAAILSVLADGEEHEREELLDAGARACSPKVGLAHFQQSKRAPGKGSKAAGAQRPDFETLSTNERLLEIAKQEVMGARLVAQKTLLRLAKPGYIQAVRLERLRGRIEKRSFRITDRGRAVLAAGEFESQSVSSRKAWATRRVAERKILTVGESDQLLTASEVAARYGVGYATVTRWVRLGLLVALKTPGGQARFIERSLPEKPPAPLNTTRKDQSETVLNATRRMAEEGYDFGERARKGWQTRRNREGP